MPAMLPWWQWRIRRTTLLMIGCAALLIGLVLPRFGVVTSSGWILMGVLPISLLCWKRRVVWAVPAVVMIGLSLGLWRGSVVQYAVTGYADLFGQKVTLEATLSQDTTYGSKQQLDMYANDIVLNGRSLPGSVRITTFSPVEPRRGDRIRAKGKLFDGFGQYQAALYFATVEVTRPTDAWYERLRRSFMTTIFTLLPDPQASLGLGFLVGLKSQLPEQLTNQLQVLGLTHIVVASGFNVTVLVRLARRLFEKRSKYQMVVASGILLCGFLLITGFSASMARAALVAALSLFAWYYGRVVRPLLLLLLAAALTAAWYPPYIWGDLGWWLSFLAFAGVLVLAPLITRRLFGEREPPELVSLAIETTCAQLLTMPLIVMNFGTLSVLAFVANLLVVPCTPVAMLLTFIAGVGGWLGPTLASWLALPALWLLTYIVHIISWLAAVPWASIAVGLAWPGMAVGYLLLSLFGWLLYSKTRRPMLIDT